MIVMFAFEPKEKYFNNLLKKFEKNKKVRVYNFALSNLREIQKFLILERVQAL